MSLDFAGLASSLLDRARSLLPQWFPAGKIVAGEFKVGDLAGSEGESLSINLKSGVWKDFATGEGGADLIALYAAKEGIEQGEAYKRLAGVPQAVPPNPVEPSPDKTEWEAIQPVPDDAPKAPDEFYRREPSGAWSQMKAVARWAYRDAEGRLMGYAVRFEWFGPSGEAAKDVLPQVYCLNKSTGKRQWRWKAMPPPRVLYNLPELLKRPAAPVLIVEGEKKVIPAQTIAPAYVALAWAGGAAAWRRSDWRVLKGRSILLWPDADEPGHKAMWELGHALSKHNPTVKLIMVEGQPEGWDAADALAEGWDWPRFKAWAVPRVKLITDGGSDGVRDENRGTASTISSKNQRPGTNDRDRENAAGAEDGLVREQGSGRTPPRSSENHGNSGRSQDRDRASGSSISSEAPVLADAPDPALARDRGAGEASTVSEARAEKPVDDAQHRHEDDHEGDRSPQREHGLGAQGVSRGNGQDHDGGAQLQRRHARTGRQAGLQVGAGERNGVGAAQNPASSLARWLAWGIERNGQGAPLTNLNNAVRVLEHDTALTGLVWFDEFLGQILTRNADGSPREWTEADDINLTLHIQRAIDIQRMGVDTVRNAIVAMAMRDVRHCVRDWLSSLSWDQQPRIERFFTQVFGARESAYTRAVGMNFWISITARVFRPGCKVDNMIVLEGSQGVGKSTALSIIGGAWYAEQHESATNAKAFAEILQGKLIIEISEMDAFDRAEVKRVKSVVSNQSDRYRDSYGRYAKDHPRQGVMIGTTNKDDWNRDDTGARRMWPVKTKAINLGLLAEWREQLFAEAVARYKAGESWWQVPDEEARVEQEKRYDSDPWIDPISEFLIGRDEATTNDILRVGLKIDVSSITKASEMRVAACLRFLGWQKLGNRRMAGRVRKVWVPNGSNLDVTPEEGGNEAGGNGDHHVINDLPF